MPRERYLLDAEEESIHSNVITADSKKDKFKNWWYYNKKPLFICILVAGALVWMVLSILLKQKPDYTIAIMSEAYFDSSALELVAGQLEQYGEDLNGDGEVLISLVNYAVAVDSGDSGYDIGAQQAAATKFAADMTMGESMIWLHDDVGYYCMQQAEELFAPIETDIQGGNPTMLPWADVKALADIDFLGYEHEILTSENMAAMFGTLRVSIRKEEGSTIERKEKLQQYLADSNRLLQNLMTGTKTQ